MFVGLEVEPPIRPAPDDNGAKRFSPPIGASGSDGVETKSSLTALSPSRAGSGPRAKFVNLPVAPAIPIAPDYLEEKVNSSPVGTAAASDEAVTMNPAPGAGRVGWGPRPKFIDLAVAPPLHLAPDDLEEEVNSSPVGTEAATDEVATNPFLTPTPGASRVGSSPREKVDNLLIPPPLPIAPDDLEAEVDETPVGAVDISVCETKSLMMCAASDVRQSQSLRSKLDNPEREDHEHEYPQIHERVVTPTTRTTRFRTERMVASITTRFRTEFMVERMSSGMGQDLMECITAHSILHEGVDLCRIRACSVWDVMRGGGHVLRQGSEGITADTYEKLSKPAQSIDSFLSHSWQQPRKNKLLELMLVYNLSAAAIAALLGGLEGFVLHWSGALPLIAKVQGSSGWACKVLSTAAYFAVFFFWGELRGLCSPGPSVFLDKYCINQAFLQEKMEGIKALGATILRSRRLIVLYSRSYFTRLWTVYEIACFMSVHSADRLLLVPEFMPKAFGVIGPAIQLGALLILALFNSKGFLTWVAGQNIGMLAADAGEVFTLALLLVCAVFFAPAAFVVMRLWHCELDCLKQTLKAFRIQNADCFDEADREVVYRLVSQLERVVGHVAYDASDEEALESFNLRVQRLLAPEVQRTFGRVGVRYRLLAACCMLGGIDRLDHVVPLLVEDGPPRQIAVRLLGAFEWGLLTGPLNIACVSLIARYAIKVRGGSERLTVAMGSLAAIVASVGIQTPTLKLRSFSEAENENVALAFWLVWIVAEVAAMLALFSPFTPSSFGSSDGLGATKSHVVAPMTIGAWQAPTTSAGPSPAVDVEAVATPD